VCLGHCLLQLLLEQVCDPPTLHVAYGLRILTLGSSYLATKGLGEGLQPSGSVKFVCDAVVWYATARLDHAITHADYQDRSILTEFGGSWQGNLLHESGAGNVVQNEGVSIQGFFLKQVAHLHIHKFSKEIGL